MIRIQLHPGRSRRLLPALLLGTSAFLGAGVGFFLIERGVFPPPLYQSPPAAEKSAAPQAGGERAREAAAVPAEAEPSKQGGTAPETPQPEPAVPGVSPEKREIARSLPQPVPAAAERPAAPAAKTPPVSQPSSQAPLGVQVLGLCERLPPVARCTLLSGSRGGEYTIEGTIPAQDVAQLYVLLDTLQRLPSRANLSFWREGKQEGGDHRFLFQGQFARPGQTGPQLLRAAAADTLFARAAAWARQSRLDSVRVSETIRAPLGQGRVRQRQKLWATGAYPQLRAFAELLAQAQAGMELEELVVVPVYGEGAGWKLARLYAVLGAAVQEE